MIVSVIPRLRRLTDIERIIKMYRYFMMTQWILDRWI